MFTRGSSPDRLPQATPLGADGLITALGDRWDSRVSSSGTARIYWAEDGAPVSWLPVHFHGASRTLRPPDARIRQDLTSCSTTPTVRRIRPDRGCGGIRDFARIGCRARPPFPEAVLVPCPAIILGVVPSSPGEGGGSIDTQDPPLRYRASGAISAERILHEGPWKLLT